MSKKKFDSWLGETELPEAEKKFDSNGLEIMGKLSEAQYWKWRLTIEEQVHQKTRQNGANVMCRLKAVELEKCKLEMVILRRGYIDEQAKTAPCKEEYDKVKGEIEKALGISLNGCSIDPYSYEVKLLPKNQETKEE